MDKPNYFHKNSCPYLRKRRPAARYGKDRGVLKKALERVMSFGLYKLI
jgi:hypothetical protein